MVTSLLGGLFNSNEKALKRLQKNVDDINALEPEFQRLSNDELQAATKDFRERLEQGETVDDLLPEAFAAVREAAQRAIGQRHYDVQLLGGMVLHQGDIAEMRTGEGKTLVATLPLYLNALEGKGVHLVTVNDYLAKRDAQWMGAIFHLLGLTVGCLQHEASFQYDPTAEAENPTLRNLRRVNRREAYAADITYGTNNEFGFDYLRDNMVGSKDHLVQRDLHFAIVDEVDNILIDEARTPLIISGPAQQSTKMYETMAKVVTRLEEEEDYVVEEKERTAILTDEGTSKVEKWLNVPNLYDATNYGLTHFVENALRAHAVYKRDKDYIVDAQGEVVIVDEFTGRLMPGRRYSEGLHQAIEAKENVKVQQETITYATITLQNYFRMYQKLAGMTGTAATEAEEFFKIYKLDVVIIPTHSPMVREDQNDLVYQTEKAKFKATADELEELYKQRRPVLVGTTSIESSERLSDVLKRRGVPHHVLNAKQHEREAAIIAEAGRLGAVTVATNMAGRGTDIVLGGSPDGRDPKEWAEEHHKVIELGGLYILGTERHESRRIDNQLRGRAGRQGDPGTSRFYVSLEDELMRRFGGDRIKGLMDRFGLEEDSPLQSGLVTKAIGQSQVKVEAYNFDIRKHLVDYDDVVNLHRSVIYTERRKIIEGADLKANVLGMVNQEIAGIVAAGAGDKDREKWDMDALSAALLQIMPLPPEMEKDELAQMTAEEIQDAAVDRAESLYEERETQIGPENMRALERAVMLRVIDSLWVEHLTAMQNLRESIGLQAYGQRDPLVMYKKEAKEFFDDLLERIQHDIVNMIFHLVPAQPGQQPAANRPAPAVNLPPGTPASAADGKQASPTIRITGITTSTSTNNTVMAKALGNTRQQQLQTPPDGARKLGRNDPCYCGSGKKYKKCHGAAA